MGLVAFALGVGLGFVGSIPAAGPLLFLVIASGLDGKLRRALALAAGGALAESLYVALAFWGFAGLLARHAELELGLRLAGAVLLVSLGALLLRKKQAAEGGERERAGAGFATGFFLVGTNPAFLATWSAVAAITYSNGWLAADPRRVPWLAAGSFAGVVLWFAAVAALAARHRQRFERALLAKLVRVLGAGLIALGLWVLVTSFR